MAIIQNKPNMNYGLWGSNGNIAVPTSEKVDLGWIIEKPPNEVMNWLQNRQDSMLQFINQRGIPTWDALTEYPKDSYTVRNGVLYKAVSQNVDKDPTLNSAIWNVAFATYTDYSNLYNEVQSIKGTEGYLDLYVSKNNPVMLGQAKGVGYKDSTGASGLDFDGTTPKIVKNGQTVANFSGDESPTDVVTFEKLKEYLQFYKVGDLYITTNVLNPSNTLGYGTWEQYGQGRALVGLSSSTSDPDWTKILGNLQGEFKHAISISEIPSHDHEVGEGSIIPQESGDKLYASGDDKTSVADSYSKSKQTGDGQPISLVQPSIIVNIWRRTN